jgi:hypothetical protein
VVLPYAYQTLARAERGLMVGFSRVTLIVLPGVGFAAAAIAASFALHGLLSHFLFPLALRPRASGAASPAQALS